MVWCVQAKKGNQTKTFYTMPEYEAWKEDEGSSKGWTIKYYKGLGTSESKDAKEYFAALDSHRKTFVWEGTRFYCDIHRIPGTRSIAHVICARAL